jgi:hypothetical protein
MGGRKYIRMRNIHSEELRNLYSSLNITRVIKSNEDEMGRRRCTHEIIEKCIDIYPKT